MSVRKNSVGSLTSSINLKGAISSPRPPSTITLEEWSKIVSRLYQAINTELQALEESQRKRQTSIRMECGEKADAKSTDTQHLVAITRAIERVRIINEKVASDETAKKQKTRIKEEQQTAASLQRRIDKFMDKDKT